MGRALGETENAHHTPDAESGKTRPRRREGMVEEDLLKVEREEVEHRYMCSSDQETDQICPVEIAQAKQAQGHQGSRGTCFNPHKGQQEHNNQREGTDSRE